MNLVVETGRWRKEKYFAMMTDSVICNVLIS